MTTAAAAMSCLNNYNPTYDQDGKALINEKDHEERVSVGWIFVFLQSSGPSLSLVPQRSVDGLSMADLISQKPSFRGLRSLLGHQRWAVRTE